jgi:hypothetical protein
MSKPRTRHATQIQHAIRHILFRQWDPIGVRDIEGSSDEYDSYIAPIYRILVGTRSEDDLIDLLCRSERDLGMQSRSPEGLRPVARALLLLDVTLSRAEHSGAADAERRRG